MSLTLTYSSYARLITQWNPILNTITQPHQQLLSPWNWNSILMHDSSNLSHSFYWNAWYKFQAMSRKSKFVILSYMKSKAMHVIHTFVYIISSNLCSISTFAGYGVQISLWHLIGHGIISQQLKYLLYNNTYL